MPSLLCISEVVMVCWLCLSPDLPSGGRGTGRVVSLSTTSFLLSRGLEVNDPSQARPSRTPATAPKQGEARSPPFSPPGSLGRIFGGLPSALTDSLL